MVILLTSRLRETTVLSLTHDEHFCHVLNVFLPAKAWEYVLPALGCVCVCVCVCLYVCDHDN